MATCGMYDYSGNRIYSVGMPAKSGVGGGVAAVLPGQFGLAVFSPRLDPKGNSVRGIAVCEALSRDFGLHMLRTTRMTSNSVIRTRYRLSRARSKLYRPPREARRLDSLGEKVEVLELTGELVFVTAEIVVTQVCELLDQCSHLILDLRRVASIDQPATLLLAELAKMLSARGKQLLLTRYGSLYGFVRQLKRRLGDPLARAGAGPSRPGSGHGMV
jgi:glutaminase